MNIQQFFLFSIIFAVFSCGSEVSDKKTATDNTKGQDSLSEHSKIEADALIDFDLNYLMGKFDPATHPDFTLVDKQYADREGLFLRKDAFDSFRKMSDAAKKEGITFVIRSATRNFDYQKQIWEGKWTGKRKVEDGQDVSKTIPDHKERALKILEYSSMPSTSRHHWGTDMDFNAFTNSYFEKGEGLKIYEWLQKYAADYGFCQPYTEKGKNRPFGYNEEKWHWSYIPVARQLTTFAKAQFKNEMIEGFLGAETAVDIGVVEKYVLGVNRECL